MENSKLGMSESNGQDDQLNADIVVSILQPSMENLQSQVDTSSVTPVELNASSISMTPVELNASSISTVQPTEAGTSSAITSATTGAVAASAVPGNSVQSASAQRSVSSLSRFL